MTPTTPPSRFLPALSHVAVLTAALLSGCGQKEQAIAVKVKPEAVWMETGTGPGQVVYPRGIAYDAKNDWFYIVDRAARIQRFDALSGKFLAAWSMPENQQGKPVGISVGPDGNLYVPDTHYHRVIVYTPDGKEVRRWGRHGNGKGEFEYPTDIAFAGDKVFVGEYGDHDRIQVFTPEGQYLYEFGSFGQDAGMFSRPQSIVILGDELYLTDACNHRVDVFSLDGKFLRTFGKVGDGPGEFRFPYGLDSDANGNLIVTEFGNNRIQKVSRDGKCLGIWGTGGREVGEVAFPWASAVDSRGRLIVVDSGNNRLQVVPRW